MASESLKMIVDMMRSQQTLRERPVDEMRASMEAMTQIMAVPDDVVCEKIDAAGIPAEKVSTPGVNMDRVILYLHGGGYVIGSINTHRDLAQRLSRAAAACVVVIDYRLGPEHPHPAAVDDATAAYRWLMKEALKPQNVVIAGDSAGGGLTVATLVALRDAKQPLPAAGVCLSPWVDLECSGESMTTKATADPMVQRVPLLRMAEMYLGGKDPRTPLASPLYADLSGLPPLLIQVGTAETLLDDSLRLAERAKKAGVDVTLESCEDMIHVFQAFAAMLPEGQQAIDRIGEFVRQRCAG
ncbi:MAG TPA: alpha/beta hydrolase [Candidatus Acidoferrales bacterium]|nr:alpha/beta hydrolase [Candidatus Acidoferrales bacterium]